MHWGEAALCEAGYRVHKANLFFILSLLLASQLRRLDESKRGLLLKITASYLAQDGS